MRIAFEGKVTSKSEGETHRSITVTIGAGAEGATPSWLNAPGYLILDVNDEQFAAAPVGTTAVVLITVGEAT